MFEEINLNHFFQHKYQDRGKSKWADFYLSEHSGEMVSRAAGEVITKEGLMGPDEINQVLIEARLKRQYLSVQKAHVFNYFRGYLTGFDNESITVDLKTIRYENVRHIQLVDFEKW